jgi:prepilin-type N-terminal cleavage/methylation domain-containing protein
MRLKAHASTKNALAFTLIELLVVIAIISVLAAILFPVFAQAKAAAKQTSCVGNMHQVGLAFEMYLDDFDGFMPDRRDLKTSLPGGWKPWTTWPTSDPRAGWAELIFFPYTKNNGIWSCPSIASGALGSAPQVVQAESDDPNAPTTNYWLWRFDRPDDPIPLDDFWGKTPDQAVLDLDTADISTIIPSQPSGVSEVEMMEDPYFPDTVKTLPPALLGQSVHFGGRNRLFLDWHVKFLKDPRTP